MRLIRLWCFHSLCTRERACAFIFGVTFFWPLVLTIRFLKVWLRTDFCHHAFNLSSYPLFLLFHLLKRILPFLKFSIRLFGVLTLYRYFSTSTIFSSNIPKVTFICLEIQLMIHCRNNFVFCRFNNFFTISRLVDTKLLAKTLLTIYSIRTCDIHAGKMNWSVWNSAKIFEIKWSTAVSWGFRIQWTSGRYNIAFRRVLTISVVDVQRAFSHHLW